MTVDKPTKSKVKSKNNKKKSKNNKKKSTNNKVNPTNSQVKSKNNKNESTKSKVKSKNNSKPKNSQVKSKNNKNESTKSKVNPTNNNVKSTNSKVKSKNSKVNPVKSKVEPEAVYYKSKGGYYYKQTQNGGSLRVSEAEYMEGGRGGVRRGCIQRCLIEKMGEDRVPRDIKTRNSSQMSKSRRRRDRQIGKEFKEMERFLNEKPKQQFTIPSVAATLRRFSPTKKIENLTQQQPQKQKKPTRVKPYNNTNDVISNSTINRTINSTSSNNKNNKNNTESPLTDSSSNAPAKSGLPPPPPRPSVPQLIRRSGDTKLKKPPLTKNAAHMNNAFQSKQPPLLRDAPKAANEIYDYY